MRDEIKAGFAELRSGNLDRDLLLRFGRILDKRPVSLDG